MPDFQIHEKFEQGEYISHCHLKQLVNYVCGNLHSWTPNRAYWEEQYNYCNKLNIVINWRKSKGLTPHAKKGEMICYRTDKLVNFLEDFSHLQCCGTV